MKKRGFAAALVVGLHFIVFSSLPAFCQTHLTPPPPSTVQDHAVEGSPEDSLQRDQLPIERRTLMISIADDGQPVVAATGEVAPPLAADLRERIDKGEMTADEGATVMKEIGALDGLSYTVPDLVEMKKDLGFPPEASFDIDDLPQLLVSHVQLTIGVGPVAASYLAERLGSASLLDEAVARTASISLSAGVAVEAAADPKAVVADSSPEPLPDASHQ